MEISFLGQGLKSSDDSVGSVLMNSLSDEEFNKFSCLVAFASLAGIGGVSDIIKNSKQHIKQFRVIVGIDQKGTSKEALEALFGLDIETSVYYTISPIIFHPKIYLFEGDKKCRIIVGSSNLTKHGLFQNMEASLKIDFTKPDSEGEKLLKQIYDYYGPFFEGKVENLQKLTQELVQKLFEGGIIPDESERIKAQDDKTSSQKGTEKTDKLEELKTLFPAIGIQKLPTGFKTASVIKKEGVIAIKPTTTPSTILPVTVSPQKVPVIVPVQDIWELKGQLVWKKSNLPASDVLYEKTIATNVTGGLRLTKADFKTIDQTTYFRQTVFGKLTWTAEKTKPYVEVVKVLFNVRILGDDKGQHRLTIRHKPSGEAGQNNYTTILSWGDFGTEIRKKDLRGKNFYLYAPPAGQNYPFYIEIK
jgi:HKD family nuclease